MAAHVYIDLWTETGESWSWSNMSMNKGEHRLLNILNALCCVFVEDENMVWQCLGLLQEGLSNSPSNAQFKLLLLLLYCRLGAFEPVVDLYSSLDAKHVQHDTIG